MTMASIYTVKITQPERDRLIALVGAHVVSPLDERLLDILTLAPATLLPYQSPPVVVSDSVPMDAPEEPDVNDDFPMALEYNGMYGASDFAIEQAAQEYDRYESEVFGG